MKYKAIIFDLDGTLVHTLPEYRYMVVEKLLHNLGLQTTKKDIDRFWFEGNRDKIIEEEFKMTPEEFWKLFEIYDNSKLRMQYTTPYGDVSIIKDLKVNNFLTGIVTGAPTRIAESEIELIGKQYFNKVICAHGDNGFRVKPDPEGIIECMRQLKVNSNEVMYVGNADEDIEAARNANILDVLIDRNEHKLSKMKPTFKIKSLYELYDILK